LCLIIDNINKYTIVVFHGNDKQFVCLVQYVSNFSYDMLCQQLHTVGPQFFLTFKVFIGLTSLDCEHSETGWRSQYSD
jgi:hypothetical protein